MKLTAAIFVYLFAVFGAATSMAKTTTTMISERGFFSLAAFGGAAQQRLLGTTGEYASYSGSSFGGTFEFRVVGEGQGELRLFGQASSSALTSKEVATDKISQTSTIFGLKSFFTERFYIGAGYGNIVQNIESASMNSSFTNPVTTVGLGFEYGLGSNFFVGLNLWYQNNPVRNEEPLTGNSYSEGGLASLSLIWSPPITIMTTTIMGGR